MIQTIGMLEFNSIAKGIETCDVMLKAAEVSLIRTSTVCPGKYIIIIYGDTGSVKASILAGEINGGNCVVDKTYIRSLFPLSAAPHRFSAATLSAQWNFTASLPPSKPLMLLQKPHRSALYPSPWVTQSAARVLSPLPVTSAL